MEGDFSKKEDDISELKRDMDNLKIQITSLQLYSQGEDLLRKIIEDLWDIVAQLFITKWDFCELMSEEMETYKTIKRDLRQV